MIVGSIKGEVPIEFCGDENIIEGYGRENLQEFVSAFLSKYSVAGEMLDILVYCRKFDKEKKPTVFSSLTVNTSYGPVSSYGIDFNLKGAIRMAMKNIITEIEKLAMQELYGSYSSIDGVAEA